MPNKLSQFWQELKRRNVIRVVTVYAGAAFVLLELVDMITDPFGLPAWTFKLAIVILSLGFIVAIILSWIYDIHPKGGMVRTEPADNIKPEDIPQSSSGWRIASYISFMVIVGLIVLNIIPRTSKEKTLKEILDKSIAVLPFRNDSPNQENEYFINGYMESILNNLCKIEDLRVISRSSVEQYRDSTVSIPDVAEDQIVSYVLEGSMQKYGDHIRLTLQLIDKNDNHVWGNQYDREVTRMEEHLSLQSEIAQRVATEIDAVITPEEKNLIEKIPTTSLTAHDFFQQGREAHWEYSENGDNKSLDRAEELYKEALKYDSTYAQAYTGLAWVYWDKHYWETILEEDFLDSVLKLSDIALNYDDLLSEAYSIKGRYYYAINNPEKAVVDFNRAISLNPNDWMAYFNKGLCLSNNDLLGAIENYYKAISLNRGKQLPSLLSRLGQAYVRAGFRDLSVRSIEEAYKLDRNDIRRCDDYWNLELGYRNYGDALEWSKKHYKLDSSQNRVIFDIIYMNTMLEEYGEALKWLTKYKIEIDTLSSVDGLFGLHRIGLVYWKNGYIEEGRTYFDKQIERLQRIDELGRDVGFSNRTAYDLAAIYAFIGEKEKAYEYLYVFNTTETMTLLATTITNDPLFENIRDDPEFQQIVRDIEAKYQAEHERVRQWLEENEML